MSGLFFCSFYSGIVNTCWTSTGFVSVLTPFFFCTEGCGGYADNSSGAVSCTGHGESILKVTLARLILSHVEQGKVAADPTWSKMRFFTKFLPKRFSDLFEWLIVFVMLSSFNADIKLQGHRSSYVTTGLQTDLFKVCGCLQCVFSHFFFRQVSWGVFTLVSAAHGWSCPRIRRLHHGFSFRGMGGDIHYNSNGLGSRGPKGSLVWIRPYWQVPRGSPPIAVIYPVTWACHKMSHPISANTYPALRVARLLRSVPVVTG